jgi:hypothetical protein
MTRILYDAFKYTVADFLATCAVEFQHLWLICSALDLGHGCSSQRNLVQLPRVKRMQDESWTEGVNQENLRAFDHHDMLET